MDIRNQCVVVDAHDCETLGARPVDIGRGDDVGRVAVAGREGDEFCVLAPR
jgi:hypothetical protein